MPTEIEIGKAVYYSLSYRYIHPRNLQLSIVSKISPSGQVTLENGMKFNSSGYQMKTAKYNYPQCVIIDNETAKQIFKEDEEKSKRVELVNNIEHFLNRKRGMGGDYFFTDEELSAMKIFVETCCSKKNNEDS